MSVATILLVDDDEVLGQVLQRVLSRQGWNVVQAGSVEQALRLARERRPQLGLLDLCLPDGDGVDLAARLEAEVGRFPLILMTAYPLRLRDHPELARQFARVLTKPLNLEELRRAVETTLAGLPAEEKGPPAVPAFDPTTATLSPRDPIPPAPEPPPSPPLLPAVGEAPAEGQPSRKRRFVAALLSLAILTAAVVLVLPVLGVPGIPNVLEKLASKPAGEPDEGPSSVVLVKGQPDTFDLDEQTFKKLNMGPPTRILAKAEPRPLELFGSLAFDPNRLGRVQSRFPGEVVELGVEEVGSWAEPGSIEAPSLRRPLTYGDRVFRGQIMAVVWSKDLGEKKSELVDALVRLKLDEDNLARYEEGQREGNVPEVVVRQARSAVSGDLNTIARARRTLHIWRVEQKEIKSVEDEAARIIATKTKRELDKHKVDLEKWARVEVRAPFDGVIVEKNVAVNALVDTSTDLFKVADLKRLAVFANAYEEDLRTLQDLQAKYRPQRVPWSVALTADPTRTPLKGFGPGGQAQIERIGFIVDPTQHTNLVIGLVDNRDERLRVGQFVSAAVEVPPPPGVVSVPTAALVEDGKDSVLFVQPDPNKRRFTLKRVLVINRFGAHAYVRSRLTAAEAKAGYSAVVPGDNVVTSAAVELKAALEEVQAKAKAQK